MHFSEKQADDYLLGIDGLRRRHRIRFYGAMAGSSLFTSLAWVLAHWCLSILQ